MKEEGGVVEGAARFGGAVGDRCGEAAPWRPNRRASTISAFT